MPATLPRARREGLTLEEVGDELVILHPDTNEIHCLHPLAASVWRLADGTRTVPQIAADLASYGHEEATEAVVWMALDLLSDADLLDERIAPPGGTRRLSRRDMVRRAAGVGTAAVFTSMALPLPAAAQSLPDGQEQLTKDQQEADQKAVQQEENSKEDNNKEADSKEENSKGGGGKVVR